MIMRIGIEATALHPPRSGVGAYTLNLLQHFWHLPEASKHEWMLFSNRALNLNGEDPGQRAVEAPHFHFRYQSIWRQTLLPLALSATQPSLCHFTNLLAPLWAPCPTVVTVHDLTIKLMPEHHPMRRRLAMGPLLGPSARRAARVITVSETSKRDIVRLLGVAPARVTVIAEAAAPCFRPLPQAVVRSVMARYGLPDRYLLYVGTIEPRKNMSRVVRALATLHAEGIRVPLVMVGALGWGYTPLLAEIEALGLGSMVYRLGYIPQEDLVALYGGATLFVFPSLYEGFGLPPLEAMACGAPVLTSSTSACAELAGDAALLVDPLDQDAITAAMRQVLGDTALAASLQARGLARAATFSWQRAAQETLAVYEEVARA